MIVAYVTLKGNYSGTIRTNTYRIYGTDISKAKGSVEDQVYSGRPLKPGKSQMTITVNGVALNEDDYTIVSYSNNTKKGTGKVTIRGKGNYGGTKTLKFKIKARKL